MKTIRLFIILIFITTLGLFVYQYIIYNDGKLHIVFCNVGQGDAILIRTPSGATALYDGGPDQKVLSCLSDYLPFWQRQLNLMLLSHPHSDHLVGLLSVLKRYSVLQFGSEKLFNKTAVYESLLSLLTSQKTPVYVLSKGQRFSLPGEVRLEILGPSPEYLRTTSPGGTIGESKEFASVAVLLRYQSFSLLLTGDSQAVGLGDALAGTPIKQVTVLQSPHHGSKTGLSKEMLQKLSPELAVISVGKNSYGHPSKETLRLLAESGIKTVRTDKNGSIEIISDGKQWGVR